jgi:putative FmdB family regulatory protein
MKWRFSVNASISDYAAFVSNFCSIVLKFQHIRRQIMPLYEYWCQQCQRKLVLYSRTFSDALPSCPRCGNDTLRRLLSTFSVRSKTYKDVYEDILSDSQLTRGMMADDPSALAEWNRRMSQGEEVAPEYEDMIGRMDKGEMPSELVGKGAVDVSEDTD